MAAFAGHEGKVTGLALLPDWTLASVSHDRTIRLWDLHTFKLMKTVKDAHESPLQVRLRCLHACQTKGRSDCLNMTELTGLKVPHSHK